MVESSSFLEFRSQIWVFRIEGVCFRVEGVNCDGLRLLIVYGSVLRV